MGRKFAVCGGGCLGGAVGHCGTWLTALGASGHIENLTHSMCAHEDIFDHNFWCNRQAIYNILESTVRRGQKWVCSDRPLDKSR